MGLGWVVMLSLLGGAIAEGEPAPVVDAECGPVEGFSGAHGVSKYWGIPFGKPPVGELRWKPPMPNECWEGTFKATKEGAACINYPAYPGQSEDCLTVNVWTPSQAQTCPKNEVALKPVLVWFHGGSMIAGAGIFPGYMPTDEMTSQMDVVSVSFNYRLAALGFLALEELSAESQDSTSGNYGLLDSIAALKWVRDNIRAFGGDPDRVTLLGQSSGGTLQLALLSTPLAKGLFHRSVVMSASARQNTTLAHAQEVNKYIYTSSGCSEGDLSCLRSKTAEEITEATAWDKYPHWSHPADQGLPKKDQVQMHPVTFDGVVVTAPYDIAWAEGTANYVPLVVGSCAQEIDFVAPEFPLNGTADQLRATIQDTIGTFSREAADKAESLYPVGEEPPMYTFTTMGADVRQICPINTVLRRMADGRNGPPIYRYITTEWPTHPVDFLGFKSKHAFHSSDTFLLFNTTELFTELPPGPANDMFIARIRKDLKEFMVEGTISNWGQYPGSTMLLSGPGFHALPGEYHARQCQFWQSEVGFHYSWNN